jgi:hypothetical protein
MLYYYTAIVKVLTVTVAVEKLAVFLGVALAALPAVSTALIAFLRPFAVMWLAVSKLSVLTM